MNEPPNLEVALFAAALELPADQRGAYLDQACAGDVALRRQVEALLRIHDEAGNFFENLASAAQPTSAEGATPGSSGTVRLPGIPSEKPGDRIGRYKLLQQIGEGGCGVVYMAQQEEPVRRRVALKVIKLGMDTRSVIARFEAERQALALMDHPNIARVLEAGATDTGRPYFVMELVRGIKITDYCDENNLSTVARLELFIQVCQAIQHAHQKGIIHRDIKPSNILVTVNDGVAVPKVIDFGIAKATQGRLTDRTLFTAFEQFLGTPAYMSPEQAEMTSLDIDTRSDIYSLGVLLYELLTSQTPFDAKELVQAGLDEIRRRIREQEPPRPSTRLSTMLGADLTLIAKHRKAEPPRLIHLLRGDLDWIVMKALEKDRTRRYETANGLAMDIQRHLSNEPVEACPPSGLYRFQKLVRRNKLAFAAAGAVVGALVLGLAVSMWLFVEKSRAEREQSRLRVQAEADKHKAQTEAARSRQVAQFLKDMLQGVGPSVALGRDTTLLREILEKTAGRIGQNLKDQPEVEADLQSTIAQVYFALGQFEQAELMCRESLRIRKKLYGNENRLVAASLYDLSDAMLRQTDQSKKQTEARILLEEALAIQRKLEGNESQDVARSLNNLAYVLMRDGKLAGAEALFRESLATRRRLLGNGHSDVAWSLQGLGEVLLAEGKPAAVEPLAREALTIRQKLFGTEHPDVARSLYYLAKSLTAQGKQAEAESLYREALEMRGKLLGGQHADTVDTRQALADLLKSQNKPVELEALYRELLAGQRAALGNDSPTVAATLSSLADLFQSEARKVEAEKALHEALDITLKLMGQDSTGLPALLRQESQTLNALGNAPEAEKLFENAIAAGRLKLGETNPILGELLHDYGIFLYHESKWEPAGENFLKSLPIRRSQQNDGLSWTLRILGDTMAQGGRYKEAGEYLRESITLYRKLHEQEDIGATAWANERLGYALSQQHKLPEAEQAYLEALSAYTKIGAVDSGAYAGAVRVLADLPKSENTLSRIEALYEQVLAAQRSTLGEVSPAVATTLSSLAGYLQSQGKQPEAEKALHEALDITLKLMGRDSANMPAILRRESQALDAMGKAPEAEKLFEASIHVARLRLGETNVVVGELLHDYGEFLYGEKKFEAAAEIYLKALPIRRAKQDDSLVWTLRDLGGVLAETIRLQEAAEYLRESLTLYRKLHDQEDFTCTAWTTGKLAGALWNQQKLPEAEQAYRDTLSVYTKLGAVSTPKYADAVDSLLNVLKDENKLAEGEALCRQILAQQRAVFTNDNPTVAQTLTGLADNLAAQGNPAEAEKVLREALRAIQQAVGSNSARSDDLTKLGHLQWQLGQLLLARHQTKEAELLFQQALQVFETAAIAFPSDPYLRQEQAFSHRLLGLAMDSSGSWAESERHYRAAIGIYDALGASNPKSVVYLSEGSYTIWMLALELDHAGHLEKAAAEFQQALALHQKGRADFPDAHEFQTRGVSINISFMDLLLRMKRYGEAEQACRDALEISAKFKTLARDECASAVQSLVEALKSDHQTAEAEKFLKDVSAQDLPSLGQRNITAGMTLFRLANLLQAQNKIEEAASRYREAVTVLSNAPIDPKDAGWMNEAVWELVMADKPSRGDAAMAVELARMAVDASRSKDPMILDTLAAAYALAGQFTNAVRIQQDAIALLKDDNQKSDYTARLKLYALGRPYRDRDRLAVRAMALLDEGKFAEAEPVARECLALREEQIPNDWRTFNARSMLGGSLLGQKKYVEAEPLLLSGYEGMKQREVNIPPGGKVWLNKTLQRLAQLCDATQRPEQAVEWRKKLTVFEADKK